MRFALSPEQHAFAASLDALLADTTPARAWASGDHGPGLALWRKLGTVGVFGLLVPEQAGGLDATAVDMVVAMDRFGYHATPGPLLESVAVAPWLLGQELLPSLAAGDLIATVTLPPHVPAAVDADVADVVLPGEPAFDWGALACAAQLVGLAHAMLDRTVAYAKVRTQFGQPIGRFQAVKHKLADVFVAVEFARPLVFGAAVTFTREDISAAKVAAGEAANLAARTALQVHGAVGYTQECDLSLWLARTRTLRALWGTASFHRTRILEALTSPRSR
ncbi:acyl-CoA dehydrogenase family protein [Actinokineospora sp. HUAS TT18]|uniref:acyl-CoA dehydrogenase family protein n=1 Tax=Actinokineospora sp. HUAS TT18 TaxID=3447451 RepID=UPI003F5234C7